MTPKSVSNVKKHTPERPSPFPPHHAEQGARERVERALIDRLCYREHLQPAPEKLSDLFRCEPVWPELPRLQVAKALQEQVPAWLEQPSNGADVLLPPLRREDVEAAAVENEVERL